MLPESTVMIITNHHDEVLLLERHDTHKLFPNEWCLPGGKIDRNAKDVEAIKYMLLSHTIKQDRYDEMFLELPYGETPQESAFRECQEELHENIYAFRDLGITLMDSHYFMHVFHAIGHDYAVNKEFPNREHVSYGWFSKTELPEKISHVTKLLLLNLDF